VEKSYLKVFLEGTVTPLILLALKVSDRKVSRLSVLNLKGKLFGAFRLDTCTGPYPSSESLQLLTLEDKRHIPKYWKVSFSQSLSSNLSPT
jgi:hypothetical protein